MRTHRSRTETVHVPSGSRQRSGGKGPYTSQGGAVVPVMLLCLLLVSSQLCAQGVQDTAVVRHAPKPHNPTKALLLSAVLPGAGQVYNHQAWKIPIVYAAIGGVAYYTYFNYTQMRLHKDEYLYRVAHDDAVLDAELAQTPTPNVYNLYQAYDKSFQLSVILCVAVYGINLLDAYVFGHLFDFQINDDLSLHLTPSLAPTVQPTVYGMDRFSLAPVATLSFSF